MPNYLKILHLKSKGSKRFFIGLIGIIVSLLLIFQSLFHNAGKTFADTPTWDFSTSAAYDYSTSKIEIANGKAQLYSGSDWYNSNWQYRKAITIDNTASSSALTNYQVSVDLDSSNFDFSKAMGNGEDLRVTDADGTTPISYYLEYFNNMNLITQDIEDFPARSGAQGWWHLSTNANDSSGNTNNGSLVGNASITNSTLKLDGNGDYVSISDNSSLDFNSSFSIETWIRPDTFPSSGSTSFVAKGGDGDAGGVDHNYYFNLGNNDSIFGLTGGPGISFGFEDSAGTNYQVVKFTQLNTGQWYHLAGVFDDTANTLSLYINGVLVNTLSNVTATPYTQDQNLLIGGRSTTAGYFDGRVREVRLFNSALSAANVLADYTSTSNKGKVWVKVPSIPASSTKTIYLYYGLKSTTNLELGVISDLHGVTDSVDKKGTQTQKYLEDYVNRMNLSFTPNLSIELGDKITNVNHDTDITNLGSIKTWFDELDCDHYYTLGNHDVTTITKAEVKTALGIDYTHKSFDIGNYHIIILDVQDMEEQDPSQGYVTESEKTWLSNELAATSKKTLIFSHQTLDTQDINLNHYFVGNTNGIVENASEVRTILENDGDVIGVFNGHLHWNNKSVINNIPYFTIGSLVEDYGKNWAEVSITNDQFLNVVYKQNGDTQKVLIWDFINNEEYNKPSGTFSLYDDFAGSSGHWSELTGLSDGNWSISGNGVLLETGSDPAKHKILNSDYSEPANYIVEANISLYGTTKNPLGGFASKIGDSSNFDAIYLANDENDDIRWKQMDKGTWEFIGQQSNFTPDVYWHSFKMKKLGDERIVYLDGVQQFDLTNSDLTNGTFGLWAFYDAVQFDNVKVTSYAGTEPTNSVGSEDLVYPNDSPTLVPTTPITFTSISGFSETATKGDGEIKYQISNNNGTTWYWYNSGWVQTTSGYTEANTASVINSNISTFPKGDGSFLFKAYLYSDGTDLVSIDSIDLTYSNDTSAPVITSVSSDNSVNNSATITWTTDESASSLVEYGLTSNYGESTDEQDTSSRVKEHTVSLSNLVSCSTYHYRVNSKDAFANEATSSDYIFETGGCLGSSSIDFYSITEVIALSGGQADLVSDGKGITLQIPASFYREDVHLEIEQLNKTLVLGTANSPSGYSAIGSSIYDLKAFVDSHTIVSNFDQDIEITISYSSSDISDIDEDSLQIFTWDGSEWDGLSGCEVDTDMDTVTCNVNHFSVFGLFGPNDTSGEDLVTSANINNTTVGGPPVCSDIHPGFGAPWLFAATAQSSSSISISFIGVGQPVDKYVLEYGVKSGEYIYSSQNLGINLQGKMSYEVKSLSPNTTYYFRVRAGNGCAVGNWSNEISAKTGRITDTNNLSFYGSNLDTVSDESNTKKVDETNNQTRKFSLSIKVEDEKGNPIEGATVVIHSDTKTSKTDENGVASFVDVEEGNHEVEISYGGYEGQESVNLTADSSIKEFNLTITVQRKDILFPPLGALIVGALILIIVIMGLKLVKLKKSRRV